jgi:ribosome biogenesis GTPase
MKGLVLRSVGSSYDILGDDNVRYRGRLKGKFKMDDHKLTNPIAVGDHVKFELESNSDENVVIEEIGPRNNYIIRKSAHKTEHSHLIASNIDEAFLIVTLAAPETSLGFIDRFLVAAESFRIPVSIVFNK